jgi:hypothetical protein
MVRDANLVTCFSGLVGSPIRKSANALPVNDPSKKYRP